MAVVYLFLVEIFLKLIYKLPETEGNYIYFGKPIFVIT